MPVIGMTLEMMQASRNKDAMGDINVNSTPKVTSIREVNVEALGRKTIEMGFEFATKYSPDIGEIKVGGKLMYLSKKNSEILKRWKSKKQLPEDVSVEVLNHLFRNCLLKIANMASDLQLPPPLQIPTVKAEEKSGK
jgi:hypothetical protein